MDVENNGTSETSVRVDEAAITRRNTAREEVDEHTHYSHRAPWLRAFVLGANDGLVSVSSLMLGVGGGSDSRKTLILSGLAGLVGGALSMACGEYISVASQRDAEEADIEKEREAQKAGSFTRRHELEELAGIYQSRGLSPELAMRVAVELTQMDVIRAHARDELGIDIDELANPAQASIVSAIAFTAGAGIPLLAGAFVRDPVARIVAVAVSATIGLMVFGAIGSWLGGAKRLRGALRVLIGGVLAMAITFGIGRAFGANVA